MRTNGLSSGTVKRQLSRSAVLVASAAWMGMSPLGARAGNLNWDGDDATFGGSVGGTGTWNLSTLNWSNASEEQAWTDTTGLRDTAIFDGTAGTVTLEASVGAQGLIFRTAGYALAGTGNPTLTLGAGGINASVLTSGTTTIGSGQSLSLLGAQTWKVGAGATLAVNATIARGNAGTVSIDKTGGTVSSTSLSGVTPWAFTLSAGTATNNTAAGLNYASGTDAYTSATAATANWSSVTAAGTNFDSSLSGTINFSNTRTANTIRLTNASVANINTNGPGRSLTTNGILTAGSGGFTLSRSNGDTTGNLIIGSSNELVLAGIGAATISIPIVDNSANAAGAVTYSIAASSTFGAANTYTGMTTINSGRLFITNASGLGSTTAGTVVRSGASLDVRANIGTEAITVGGVGAGGLFGALLNTSTSVNGTIGGSVTLTDNTSVSVTTTSVTLALNGNIDDGPGEYAITKNGAGIVTMSGSNTYQGGTTVAAGTLRINNGSMGSGAGSGAVTVGDGTNAATLGGNGTIANGSNAITVNNNAIITAGTTGSTTGKLTTGDQAWNAGGQYTWKLASRAPGGAGAVGGWDQLAMATLDLSALGAGNQFKIVAVGMGAMTLQAGDTFQIATYTGTDGTPVASMFVLDVSQLINQTTNVDSAGNYSLSFSGTGISVSYNDMQPAPEPGVAILVGLGGVSILGRRRARSATRRTKAGASG